MQTAMRSMKQLESITMTTSGSTLSERAYQQIPYDAIVDVAPVGAIIFLITDTGRLATDNPLARIFRKWQGFAPVDTTNWHTTIYDGPRKESNGGRFRPYVIHSSTKGTTRDVLPREYFKNTVDDGRIKHNRVEVLVNPDLSKADYQKVIEVCRSQLGKPFDGDPGWRREWPTYLLGIRSRRKKPEEISCHGLAYNAYHAAGMKFPHQLEAAPNLLGRVLGKLPGHPPDHVDLDYLYLRDHHLYRDTRFQDLLAVAGGGTEIKNVQIKHLPGKYSWSKTLRQAYGFLALLALIPLEMMII